jgi:GNAT superfamily N-acetyltransferase
LSSVGRPRTLERGEEPKLEALFADVYGPDWRTKTAAHRYLGPTPWPAAVSVVEMDGLIVGAQPAYDVPISVRGARRMCTILADVVTHPQYRRRGIFASVVDHAAKLSVQRDSSLALTTPNNASYPGFEKKRDWRLLTTLPCWLRLLRPGLILTRGIHLPTWLSHMLDLPLLWLAHGAARSQLASRASLAQTPSAESLDDLWRRSSRADRIRQCRDSVWARWRFAASGDEYQFLTDHTSDGRLAGYVVMRLKRIRGVLASFVVDGLWSEEAAHTPARLMEAACAWAYTEGAALALTYATPAPDWLRGLSQARFRRLPRALSMRPYRVCARLRPGDADDTLLTDSAAWQITLADSDLV